jgi:hypothetical protein
MDRRAPPREQVAQALHECSVHDPYCLLFGPDNPDFPGRYVLRVMLAVPEDRATECCWTATSPERARAMIPPSCPAGRRSAPPRGRALEQWRPAR